MATNQQIYGSMTARWSAARVTRSMWVGRVLSGLVVLFLLQDGFIKAASLGVAVDATVKLGYPEDLVTPIGITLLVSTLLYAIPRTAVIGAILLTGYLGGAMASQVRLEDPWFLFPAVLAVLAWVGLALRDDRIRNVVL